MTNLQGALGVAQLEQLDTFVKKKRAIGDLYNKKLKIINNIHLPLQKTSYANNIYWVYGILISNNISLNSKDIMLKLKLEGIGTRPFFYPLHKQPVLLKNGYISKNKFPVSEELYNKGFYIPSGLSLSENQITQVSEKIIKIFKSINQIK